MRTTILAVLSILLQHFSYSQHTIEGQVIDAEKAPLMWAVVTLQTSDSSIIKSTNTDMSGHFALQTSSGNYLLSIELIGFEKHTQPVRVTEKNVAIGVISLKEEAVLIDALVIDNSKVAVTQKGDTTQYNADQFKTNPDATADDLVRKMPGITTQNGSIQAQGEDVKKVLVDGKPFFGDDPKTALKNIPAEMIDKIQVYDEQSAKAKATGIRDADDEEKTINIVTKPAYKTGTFGNIYAGYGTDERYKAGAVINLFSKDRRVTFVGQSNNINEQNFSSADLSGVSGQRRGWHRSGPSANDFIVDQQGGITTTHAAGINYSETFSKELSFTGNYFFNKNSNDNQTILDREFFLENSNQNYQEGSLSNSDNQTHRFRGDLKYETDKTTLRYRPSITLQQNEGVKMFEGTTFNNDSILNTTSNDFRSDFFGYNISNRLDWVYKLKKEGRSISVDLEQYYNKNDAESHLDVINTYENGLNDTINQQSTLDKNEQTYKLDFDYTEPLGKNLNLRLSYEPEWNINEGKKYTNALDNTGNYTELDTLLSNVSDSRFNSNEFATDLRYNKKKFSFRLGLAYKIADLASSNEFPTDENIYRSYQNFLPRLTIHNKSENNNMFIFHYRTGTRAPSIDQLLEAVDNTNAIQLTTGNTNLDQQYEHRLFTKYAASNANNNSSYYFLFGGTYYQNYISKSTYIAEDNPITIDNITLSPGTQLTKPVNVDGYYDFYFYASYGLPFKLLKSNLNLGFSTYFKHMPTFINEEQNIVTTPQFRVDLGLSSNISEKVDFNITSKTYLNYSNNTLNAEQNTRYIQQSTTAEVFWNFWKHFNYRTQLQHNYYYGLNDALDPDYLLWNMSVGMKFLKDLRGELILSVFDVLKQNNSLSRNTTETFVEDSETQVLQQYFMLTFRYNLRSFKKEEL